MLFTMRPGVMHVHSLKIITNEHLCTPWFKKYMCRADLVPGTVVGTWLASVNKRKKDSVLAALTVWREELDDNY